MVQFVNHFFPNQKFDVVEIDPIIVEWPEIILG